MNIKLPWKRGLLLCTALVMTLTLVAGCAGETSTYPDEDKDFAVFGYYWAPTALMGAYDWYVLEEPEYDAELWQQIILAKDDPSLRPLSEACAYEVLPVNKGINPSLRDIAPEVVAMLDEMMVGLEAINRTAAWAKENEVQDWEEAAIWYLGEYEDDWQTWITTEAYDKVMAALGGEPQGTSPDKPTILFADNQFESIWINNAVAKFIIEEGYGYPVETIEMTTVIAQVSLAQGDVHVWLEMWEQNWIENYNDEVAAGNIENLGMVYEGGPQMFVIPMWVHEKYDIVTIFDMADHWELFQDPEDSSKGLFLNCIIGWQCQAINLVKLEAYGLLDYYNLIEPGSAGALEAALAAPQIRYEASK